MLLNGVTLAYACQALGWNASTAQSEFKQIAQLMGRHVIRDGDTYRYGDEAEKEAQRKAQIRFDPDDLIPWLEEQYHRTGYAFGSRGWCYFAEGYNIITKGDFAAFESKLTEWRKKGLLNPDVVADDDSRSTQFIESVDDDPEAYARTQFKNAKTYLNYYEPVSFWEGLNTYIEVLVEKSDLVTIFEQLCRRYNVPITNAKGAFDVNGRRRMLQRMRDQDEQYRDVVLLYFGDFDPIGVRLSDTLHKNLEDCARVQDVMWSPANVVVERVGLSLEQIEDLGLTWVDNLKTSSGKDLADPKHKLHNTDMVQDWLRDYGERKVEANALVRDPASAQRLLEAAINRYVPASHLADHAARLEPHREAARAAFRKIVNDEGEAG